MDGYLANNEKFIRKSEETLLKKIENNTISDRLAKTCKREINDLKEFEKNRQSQMPLNILMSGLQ